MGDVDPTAEKLYRSDLYGELWYIFSLLLTLYLSGIDKLCRDTGCQEENCEACDFLPLNGTKICSQELNKHPMAEQMFAARTRQIWNNLSDETIQCGSLDDFKEALEKEMMANDKVFQYHFTETAKDVVKKMRENRSYDQKVQPLIRENNYHGNSTREHFSYQNRCKNHFQNDGFARRG